MGPSRSFLCTYIHMYIHSLLPLPCTLLLVPDSMPVSAVLRMASPLLQLSLSLFSGPLSLSLPFNETVHGKGSENRDGNHRAPLGRQGEGVRRDGGPSGQQKQQLAAGLTPAPQLTEGTLAGLADGRVNRKPGSARHQGPPHSLSAPHQLQELPLRYPESIQLPRGPPGSRNTQRAAAPSGGTVAPEPRLRRAWSRRPRAKRSPRPAPREQDLPRLPLPSGNSRRNG